VNAQYNCIQSVACETCSSLRTCLRSRNLMLVLTVNVVVENLTLVLIFSLPVKA